MNTTFPEIQAPAQWAVLHPFGAADRATMAAMRAIVEPNKGRLQGTAARVPFDSVMGQVKAPAGVDYEADRVGGVPGWWCRPKAAGTGQAIMHLHGGWFNWGSAKAYRHLAGHLALRAGVVAFVPDYRLAPEHPFPSAVDDTLACYLGLIEQGFSHIAITGDSAGGGLALGLLVQIAAQNNDARKALVGGVLLSPVTDLTFSGESWSTRAAADPYFTRHQATELVHSYLVDHDPAGPLASPLYADLQGLVPIRVHVGNDEVLLDDSVRLVKRAIAAGVDAHLDIWEGMVHGFLASVGSLEASNVALQLISEFLTNRFADHATDH